MNIVFIDDDAEDVELFCEIVHEIVPRASCQAIYDCTDLETNLAKLETPDLIFLDGHMSPVSGKECLAILQTLPALAHTKIVIHTGSISSTEENEFREMGVHDVIYKGSSYEEISMRLKSMIDPVQEKSSRNITVVPGSV